MTIRLNFAAASWSCSSLIVAAPLDRHSISIFPFNGMIALAVINITEGEFLHRDIMSILLLLVIIIKSKVTDSLRTPSALQGPIHAHSFQNRPAAVRLRNHEREQVKDGTT